MWLKAKLGQSILGFVFAFVIIAALAVGLTRVWVWFNVNYGVRQARYQESRTAATRPPVSGNEYLTDQIRKDYYAPIDLTDEWLFKGKVPEGDQVPWDLPDIPSPINAAIYCSGECPECIVHTPAGCDCADEENCICAPDPDCVCYMQCMCHERVKPRLTAYDKQIEALKQASYNMRKEAKKLENKADDCDDPWEFCWWGGFGMPAKKLRQAAGKLRSQAEGMCLGWCNSVGCWSSPSIPELQCPNCNNAVPESSAPGCVANSKADFTGEQKEEVEACCDTTSTQDMAVCFEEINVRQCPKIRDANMAMWNEAIRVLRGDINLTEAIQIRIPTQLNDWCPKWAYIRCKYSSCRPGAETLCEQQCQNYGDTECAARCTTDCIFNDPPLPAELVCYNGCLNDHCLHDCVGLPPQGCDWYQELYTDCMTNTYPGCVQTQMGNCAGAVCNSSHPLWDTYLQECCNSFCCTETPNSPPYPNTWDCTWGVFDKNKWGYTDIDPWWECGDMSCPPLYIGCDATECQDSMASYHPLPLMDFNLVTGGDHCERTWRCAMARDGAPQDHISFCLNNPWMRNCVNATSNCDEECTTEGLMLPPGAPGNPSDYVCNPDEAGYFMPPSCFTGQTEPPGCSPISPPDCVEVRTRCGLSTFANRQFNKANSADVRDCYQYEINRYDGKKSRIADCCGIPWVIGPPDDPTHGRCCSPGRPCIDGMTHFECQALCMQDAGLYGEDAGEEPIPCSECYPDPPLPPDELDECLDNCYGFATGCCGIWCSENVTPENMEDCLNVCIARCEGAGCEELLCVDEEGVPGPGFTCTVGCMGSYP